MIMDDRGGDWIQIFLVMFFALLLVITLALLFIEKGSLEDVRPELNKDISTHNGNAFLISLMRMPVQVDINDDGRKERGTLAQLIVKNPESEEIKQVLDEVLDHYYYGITIDGREIHNVPYVEAELEDEIESGDPLPFYEGEVRLPGGITIHGTFMEKSLVDRLAEEQGVRRASEVYEEALRDSRTRSGGGLGA